MKIIKKNIVCIIYLFIFPKHPVMQERFSFQLTKKKKQKKMRNIFGRKFLTNSNNIGK